jgi:transcriptional regulator with XRE-family HTH domain
MTAAESLRPEDSLWHLIAVYLRKERQRRKLSQSDVAAIILADKQRVANTEAGRINLTQRQAELLDQAWGTMFVVLRRYAVMLGRDQEWAKQLIDFETGALIMKLYFSRHIPVPFQTEDYARALIVSCRVLDDVETAVRKRMARQKSLRDQLTTTSLWLLVDEAALRPYGIPPAIMRDQLAQMLEFSERASVRVVPQVAPVHIGIDGDFQLITTATGAQVAYVWAQMQGRLVQEAFGVRNLALRYDRIGARALTEEDSRQLITNVMERLSEHPVAQE